MTAPLFRTRTIAIPPVALAACLVLGAHAALAQSIEGPAALADTYWRAVELLGKPTPPARAATREAHVQFLADGRVSGSDGCNRIAGSYELTGDAITFGPMLGTQMACPDSTGTERPFRDALARAARVTVTTDRLELFDTAGTRVAAFAARDTSAAFTVPGR